MDYNARERSSNLGVEAARLVDIWDHQKTVWTNYFRNIGTHWKDTEGVEPGEILTAP